MTIKQKLLLLFIYFKPGIKDIYSMVKIYDRADFPARITENLGPLLEENLIFVSNIFDNGTPSKYDVTEKGKIYVNEHINIEEIIQLCKKDAKS